MEKNVILYLSEQNIIIPPRAMFEDDWWDKDLDYFTEEIIKDWNHVPVKLEDIQPNDVLIFKLMAKVNNHCGVYIGDDIFYHHSPCFGEKSTRLLVASDFIYSISRLTDEDVVSPGSWVMDYIDLERTYAINDTIIEINLN